MRRSAIRAVLAAVLTTALMTGLTSAAQAAVGDITEFPALANSQGGLNRVTSGPDGNIWFTIAGANQIGQMTPGGVVTRYDIPTANSSPIDITTGSDGNLWFTEFSGRIGRISPATGQITEFPVFNSQKTGQLPKTQKIFLFGITAGPDGALWFVANCCDPTGQTGYIGRITTDGRINLFPVAKGTSPTVGITTGPDGNLWFPATNITCGNKNQLCGQRYQGYIERMSSIGQITGVFPIPTTYSDPSRIVTGPDGNLWFTEQGAVGANGSLQPTFPAPGKIGRITPDGQITEFTTPNQNWPYFTSNPAGIAVGPDGNIWFTEYSYLTRDTMVQHGGNNIGMITPSGQITEFPVPTQYARADGIAAGPPGDGGLYFTESPNNFSYGAIGRVQALP